MDGRRGTRGVSLPTSIPTRSIQLQLSKTAMCVCRLHSTPIQHTITHSSPCPHVEHLRERWLMSRPLPPPDRAPSEEMATSAAFMAAATCAQLERG